MQCAFTADAFRLGTRECGVADHRYAQREDAGEQSGRSTCHRCRVDIGQDRPDRFQLSGKLRKPYSFPNDGECNDGHRSCHAAPPCGLDIDRSLGTEEKDQPDRSARDIGQRQSDSAERQFRLRRFSERRKPLFDPRQREGDGNHHQRRDNGEQDPSRCHCRMPPRRLRSDGIAPPHRP